jgi:hypothetical protein
MRTSGDRKEKLLSKNVYQIKDFCPEKLYTLEYW